MNLLFTKKNKKNRNIWRLYYNPNIIYVLILFYLIKSVIL